MRFCPVCQTRYEEEIIKFCTNDGTPLVEESPSFTAMPSQTSIDINDDEADQQTIIRRTPLNAETADSANRPQNFDETDFKPEEPARPKIIIPTKNSRAPQIIRQADTALPPSQRQSAPVVAPAAARKSNTAMIVVLTILSTLAILAGIGGVMWFLSNKNADQPVTSTVNANINPAANADLNNNGLFANLNTNSEANINVNINANTNINAATPKPTKTPAPTPTKTPAPTPSPTPNANTAANSIFNAAPSSNSLPPANRPAANTLPPAAVTPRPPQPSAPPANQIVNVGIINSRAASLTKPAYPPIAKQMRASGQVSVQVIVDENGNVTSARAVSGNQLLRGAAEAAARQSRFNPIKIGDQPVRATGTIVYNFIDQ